MSDDGRRLSRRSERANRLYALFLRLYPRAHRRAFGDQMLRTFADHYRDAVEEGQNPTQFWLGVLADVGASLLREHRLALGERLRAMSKRAVIGWASGLLGAAAAIGLLGFLSHSPAGAALQQPMPGDSVGRALLSLALLLLTLGLYAALVAAIAGYMRGLDRSGRSPGWLRLGLALGAIIGLYAVVSNALGILLPGPADGATQVVANVLGGTLPLLFTGMVGLIGGYTSGTARRGVAAGVLAGFLGLLVNQLSWVLVVALAWPAIQHGQLPSGVEADFYRYTQAVGHPLTLGSFLNLELFEDGIGFPIITGLMALALEAVSAAVGGVIGSAVSRSCEQHAPTTQSAILLARAITFLLTTLALGLLLWVSAVEFNGVGGDHRLLGPSNLGISLANQNLALWLLGILVVLTFVLITTQLALAQPEARTASE